MIAGLTIFLRNLKKKLYADKTLPAGQPEYVVLGYPLLSSVIIVLCVFQFIFRNPHSYSVLYYGAFQLSSLPCFSGILLLNTGCLHGL
jgi:hypothetical protein